VFKVWSSASWKRVEGAIDIRQEGTLRKSREILGPEKPIEKNAGLG